MPPLCSGHSTPGRGENKFTTGSESKPVPAVQKTLLNMLVIHSIDIPWQETFSLFIRKRAVLRSVFCDSESSRLYYEFHPNDEEDKVYRQFAMIRARHQLDPGEGNVAHFISAFKLPDHIVYHLYEIRPY